MKESFLSTAEGWDERSEELKVCFDKSKGLDMTNVSAAEKELTMALDKIDAMVKFCFTVPGFKLRPYQRMVARCFIIAGLPYLIGLHIWRRQSLLILKELDIPVESYDNVFITKTSRRFGKSRVMSIYMTGQLYLSADVDEGYYIALFANNQHGSVRLLEAIGHVIELTRHDFEHMFYFEMNKLSIYLRPKAIVTRHRYAVAHVSHGQVSEIHSNTDRSSLITFKYHVSIFNSLTSKCYYKETFSYQGVEYFIY